MFCNKYLNLTTPSINFILHKTSVTLFFIIKKMNIQVRKSKMPS